MSLRMKLKISFSELRKAWLQERIKFEKQALSQYNMGQKDENLELIEFGINYGESNKNDRA